MNNEPSQTLDHARIAVLGYGSQGRAHALNLHDSGLNVVVGARPDGPSWQRAIDDGLNVPTPADAVSGADVVAVLTPDMVQPDLSTNASEPHLRPGAPVPLSHRFHLPYQ